MVYDCSYDFGNEKIRKKYKYVVIKRGDLDINNAMMLRGKEDVRAYLKECKGSYFSDNMLAILEVSRWFKK